MIMSRWTPTVDRPAPLPEQIVAVNSDRVELESVDCPLCGGQDYETVIVTGDRLTRLGGNFQVVRCRYCELAFTNPRPTPPRMGLFYPQDYGPYAGHGSDGHRQRPLQRRLEQAVLRRYFGYPTQHAPASTAALGAVGSLLFRSSRRRMSWIPYRAPGRLLDFGCGAGEYMKRMRGHGWNVEGVDVSPRMAERLRQTQGIRVHVGTLPHPDVYPESIDAVTMWHSLEHVYSPRGVLQAAHESLRTGGILAVAVPNIASWSFRQFQHDWFGLELPRHLTHFSPGTLSKMAEAVGFRVLSVGHIGSSSSMRRSARRATASGSHPRMLRSLRSSWCSRPVARWTERTGRADCIRMIAEKS